MNCKLCGQGVAIVPAGTSKKTGRAYASFYKCKNCQHSESLGAKPTNTPTPAQTAPRTPVSAHSSPQAQDPRFAILNRKLNRLLEVAGLEQDEINSLEF